MREGSDASGKVLKCVLKIGGLGSCVCPHVAVRLLPELGSSAPPPAWHPELAEPLLLEEAAACDGAHHGARCPLAAAASPQG